MKTMYLKYYIRDGLIKNEIFLIHGLKKMCFLLGGRIKNKKKKKEKYKLLVTAILVTHKVCMSFTRINH